MWLIGELSRRTSAEQPLFEELAADGEVLSNAVNHVDWSEAEVLLSRCTFCGGDDSDGWVRLRRSGDLVVLQPLIGGEPWAAPPSAFARMGIAVVPYALLRSFAKRLPPLDRIEAWTADDAILALQLENAPLLGRAPEELHVPADRLVASSMASLDEGIAALRACMAAYRNRHVSVLLRPLRDDESPIWFYVEGREPGDWLPLADAGGVPVPYFAPGLAAVAR